MTGSTSTGGTQALDRAGLLVSTVVRADEPLGFTEIQERCELPKSTTSRLLAALERTELLERNDEGYYVAGPLFWLYATRHDPWDELVRLAQVTLEEIGADTRETVNLAVARGDRVVHVAQVDAQYLLGTRDWTEIVVPAHTSAVGKVLLAGGALELPRGPLEPVTDATVTDRRALNRQLRRIAADGWAATVDELEVGLTGVAAPVLDSRGEVMAALGVSGPSARLDDARTAELGEQLVAHAERLTRKLTSRNPREGVA